MDRRRLSTSEFEALLTPHVVDRMLFQTSLCVLFYHKEFFPSNQVLIAILGGAFWYSIAFSWFQHATLDNVRSLKHVFPLISTYSAGFQHHHENPTDVLYKMDDSPQLPWNIQFTGVTPIVFVLSPMLLLTNSWLLYNPCQYTLNVLLFSQLLYFWGHLSIRNHVTCHAETHKYPKDRWCVPFRTIGLLPSPAYHRTHHNPSHPTPHEQNWAFDLPSNKRANRMGIS